MNNKEKYYLAKLARRGRKTNVVEPPVQVELEDPTPPIVELPEAPPKDKPWQWDIKLGPGGPHNTPPKKKPWQWDIRLGPGGPHNTPPPDTNSTVPRMG